MFASRTVVGHIVRGVTGMGAVAGAFAAAPSHPIVALLALTLALVAFRGCPMCWTLGLFETVFAARGRRGSIECAACRPEDSP